MNAGTMWLFLLAIFAFATLNVPAFPQIVKEVFEGSIYRQSGDIHPGGNGEVDLALTNVYGRDVYVYGIELFVEATGYVGSLSLDRPVRLGVNETKSGLWVPVSLPPMAPTGNVRAYAHVRTSIGDEPNVFTVTVHDVCCIQSLPYRSFKLEVRDYTGGSAVPYTTVTMKSYSTGMTYTYSSESGVVNVDRLHDDYYEVTVWYRSPYDGRLVNVHSPAPYSLYELASSGMIKTKVFDVQLKARDISGRPLNATAYLGNVEQRLDNGFAVFRNVPYGRYNVSIEHRGVEVFRGNVTVTSPVPPLMVGAYINATAAVGDIILDLRDADGRRTLMEFSARISGMGIHEEKLGRERLCFYALPKGEYDVSVYAYNRYLGKNVTVGHYRVRIPENHGENLLNLSVFDGMIVFKDYSGDAMDIKKAYIEGKEWKVTKGILELPDATEGEYRIEAYWMGIGVFDGAVALTKERRVAEVRLKVYDVAFRLKTMDGSPLSSGTVVVSGDGFEYGARSNVDGGVASFQDMPEAPYNLTVTLWDRKVFSAKVYVRQGEYDITVDAYDVRVRVADQYGKPVEAVEVTLGKTRAVTDKTGVAMLGQVPSGRHQLRATYRGFTLVEREVAVMDKDMYLAVPLYSLRVTVLNELGSPLDADVELSRGFLLVDKKYGSLAEFHNLPEGRYTLKAYRGSKGVEQQISVPGSGDVRVKLPVVAELGGVALGMDDLCTMALPMMAAAVIAGAILTASRLSKKVRKCDH
ncbi:MAG: hypothetical protein B9J98_04050 [Candidatus Terraquivivens tikiterensis]|uniref:Carboxypeptidase regulatory-like domain-containing protein n=1 Tax=Candidatus Terraquivivens tikiterensis TaxID=1980982 RepID=A0A2R7Y6X3_9ARCH|nr:MAG: hypothetical protein B9J98_04050 [Candidatus Terraquivivens tikiterensis]